MRHFPKTPITKLIRSFRSDYRFATLFTSGLSTLADVAFVAFNGIFGSVYRSVWHLSIFAYYALLLAIRGHILISIAKKRPQRQVCLRVHILLILMSLALFFPARSMVFGEREYHHGLIPAIAVAAYTTYRIVMASVHLKRGKRDGRPLIKLLRTIGFADALVAVMTMQNTLIMANGGMVEEMKTLCAWTNGGIILSVVSIVLHSFVRVGKTLAPTDKASESAAASPSDGQ